jgi:hypothetical protein
MSITEKLYERMRVVSINGFGTSASTTLTSGTADLDNCNRLLLVGAGFGTGTVGITCQAGSLTYGTNSAGIPTTGNIPEWATLSAGNKTAGCTYDLTNGEIVWIEIDPLSMPANSRYIRALISSGSNNTYGSLMIIEEDTRYNPVDNSNITEESSL